MRIDVTHSLDQAEAIGRLDSLVDTLVARDWPGGVAVSDARKNWAGPRMSFSFSVGKGGFGVSIAGWLDVAADLVTLEADLPMLVRAVVGEDRVRQAVSEALREVLNGGSGS